MNTNDYEILFIDAWSDSRYTQIELPALDINSTLAAGYTNTPTSPLTRTQLWDMEVRKAARPDLYITKVIRPGTARSWGRRKLDNGDETFIRVSEQRLWLQPDTYGTVIEACYLNHAAQKVTFLGLPEVEDDAGHLIVASSEQPLFHVEHGVSGAEELPLNAWRIVHLTKVDGSKLVQRFNEMAEATGLPEYVERYIENVLGHQLSQKRG
ncbi:MAG: hypothetical protein P1U58_20240 [Verrucomicrobiales bacterium]|nr:hypothetical protein [Verrucomicrobiales bacterium]